MSDQREPDDPSVPLSIETPAVTAAQQAVASYLQRVPPGAGTAPLGVVIGLSGPPGAGKTHLATRIVRRLNPPPAGDAEGRARLLAIRLRAVEANGNQLYTAFVDAMSRSELTAAVRDHLADPFAPGADQEWPSDGLRTRLTSVVGDRGYALALAHLTHPELADDAWAWLRGGPSTPRLAERGLLGPAVGGLPGIGILARFWLGRGGRLVLVVDDVDRLVRGPDRAQQIDAVRRLLEELRNSGCLVFVTGSAEALSDVEIGPYRRLGTRIDVGGFDVDTAAGYIRSRTGTGTLGPFELPAVTRLVELTDGNPARLAGLVDRLLRAPQDAGGPVTAELVTAEARRQLSSVDRPTVAAAVRRVLDGLLGSVPLAFSAAYQATLDQAGRLDFWIPMTTPGPGTAGCGVLIADAIVAAADLQPLIATADALTRADIRAEVLVVLTGPVSGVHLERLRHEFRREPLPYASGTFDDDLAVAVKAMIQSFDDQGEAAQFAGLNRRIEQIDRQQLRTLDAIQRMSGQLDALRPDQATALTGPRSTTMVDDRLPAPVHDVFGRVLGALEQLDAAPSAARGLFALGGSAAEDTRNGLRRTTDANSATLRAFGSVSLIEAVVQEFQAAVRRWFDSAGASRGLVVNSAANATLVELCTRYDDAINAINLADLHRLQPISGSAPTSATRVDQATRAIRDLGRNVRTAVELTAR